MIYKLLYFLSVFIFILFSFSVVSLFYHLFGKEKKNNVLGEKNEIK